MKKLILILTLVIGFTAQAQFTLTAAQDVKLATMEDGHGNTPFTGDVIIIPRLFNEMAKGKYEYANNIFVYIPFEYADLDGGRFIRYGMGLGYRFKDIFLNVNDNLNKIEVIPSFDYGIINRWGASSFSWNLILDISYNITKTFNVGFLFTLTERSDLNAKWGTKKPTEGFYFKVTKKWW